MEKEISLTAKEFLEKISPTNSGIRADLEKYRLRRMVEGIMDKYHEHKLTSLNEPVENAVSDEEIEAIIKKSEQQAIRSNEQDMRENNVENAYWSWFIIKLKQNMRSLPKAPAQEAVDEEVGIIILNYEERISKLIERAELSETQIIKFAEWLPDQEWTWSHQHKEWKPWVAGHVFYNDKGKTAQELYSLYLKEETNK